ncbi:MAG: hypothetical protein ABDH18_05880 [Aquificaceae bacterium]
MHKLILAVFVLSFAIAKDTVPNPQQALIDKAVSLNKSNRPGEALEVLKKALEAQRTEIGKAQVKLHMAHAYFNLGSKELSSQLIKETMPVFLKHSDRSYSAQALYLMSDVLRSQDNHGSAVSFFSEVSKDPSAQKDPYIYGTAVGLMASHLYESGRYDEALKARRQAIEIFSKAGFSDEANAQREILNKMLQNPVRKK